MDAKGYKVMGGKMIIHYNDYRLSFFCKKTCHFSMLIALCILFSYALFFSSPVYAASDLMIQNFERKKGLAYRVKNISRVKHGKSHPGKSRYAGRWDSDRSSASTVFTKEKNWSAYNGFSFLIHSERINNQRVKVILYSQNVASDGHDYYEFEFNVDWIGWKRISLGFSDMKITREPLGFSHIDEVVFRGFYPPENLGKPQFFMIDEVKLIK